MRNVKELVVAVAFAVTFAPGVAQQPAFPGAEGFGRHAAGGRGGDVYHAINLKDSGPGSLREGIRSATGPRTIGFRVAGTISLESDLVIDKGFLTIAGQTVPGGGITVRNFELQVQADHIILRYIRSRLGDRGAFAEGGHRCDLDRPRLEHYSRSL